MSESEQIYGIICYLALVDDHGEGWEENADPSYLMENLPAMQEGEYAFTRLDDSNQERVRKWCRRWDVSIPTEWRE